jgi:hypothetical protein
MSATLQSSATTISPHMLSSARSKTRPMLGAWPVLKI